MAEIAPLRLQFETEAEEDARLLWLRDSAHDESVPASERVRALDEMLEILWEREPIQFEYAAGVSREQGWMDAWLRTLELLRDGKISGRRAGATAKKLLSELRFEMDDAERATIARLLEPLASGLPLLRAAIERREIEEAGGRLN